MTHPSRSEVSNLADQRPRATSLTAVRLGRSRAVCCLLTLTGPFADILGNVVTMHDTFYCWVILIFTFPVPASGYPGSFVTHGLSAFLSGCESQACSRLSCSLWVVTRELWCRCVYQSVEQYLLEHFKHQVKCYKWRSAPQFCSILWSYYWTFLVYFKSYSYSFYSALSQANCWH